jgi:hypothetical protein
MNSNNRVLPKDLPKGDLIVAMQNVGDQCWVYSPKHINETIYVVTKYIQGDTKEKVRYQVHPSTYFILTDTSSSGA